MSTELPPPPPPPPPEGDNSAPQAPKLKLAKPVAAIPPPPPPPAAAPVGAAVPAASAPRPSPSFNAGKDRGVTKTEGLVDVFTLVAAGVAVFFLAAELFTNSKG